MKTITNRIALITTTACLMTLITPPARAAEEEWVRRYSLLTGSHDTAKKVVADASGNVIVAGLTSDDTGWLSLLIIKYSADGVPLWTNRNNEQEVVSGLAVDGNGDVIVIGASPTKYSGDGVPLWTNLFEGRPTAVAVDSSGNAFVTGEAWDGFSSDYVTTKYSPTGVPLWTNPYHGPGNFSVPSAIAVDGSGNVIVTGRSEADGFSYVDFATVKYSGAGVPLWTNRYNGGGDTSLDYMVTEIAVDDSGNSFVTGESFDGVSTDYATIKYSASGVPLWTNRYHGPGNYSTPGAIAVDGSGNVFITGASADELFGIDYATVAYSGAGVPLWTNLYNGPGDDLDRPRAMAVDESGNVFVTGFAYTGSSGDCATIKFSNSGVPLWTNRYNGPEDGFEVGNSIAVDDSGNVFVAGDTADGTGGMGETDFLIIAYSGAGAPLWTNRYNKLFMRNDDSAPTAMVVDGSGNLLVTGSSDAGPGFNANYATIKYSSTGVLLWAKWYNGPGNGEDRATGVAVDSSGNVYVTGRSVGSSIFEYATIKYSDAGVPLWTNRYSWESMNSAFAAAIAVDPNGNAYVTGYSYENGGYASYATVKYSSAGVPLWTNRYTGPGNFSEATGVAVDSKGDVFVTGYSYGTGYPEFATIKYSGAGVPLWTNRYGGTEPESGPDVAYAIAVDANGSVFVTGYSAYTNAAPDYTTVAYSGAGVPLWTNRYSGPGASIDEVHAIAVAANGNVFVTGVSSTDVVSSSADYATVAYSGAGVPLWTNRYNGTANDSDSANAVTADGSGNVYVTGASDGDYVTIKYSGAGVPLWTNRYNGTGNGFDNAVAVAVDGSGSVFVTGASWDGLNFDFATIKYSSVAFLPIPLDYHVVGNQLVLSWTNAAFGLQAAPAVEGVYTNVPGATSPYTNVVSDLQRYFRLKAD